MRVSNILVLVLLSCGREYDVPPTECVGNGDNCRTGRTSHGQETSNDSGTGYNDPAGTTGPMGVPGPQGPAGTDGAAGKDGSAGRDGKDGESGAAGPIGATGAQGPAGAQGAPGIPATGVTTVEFCLSQGNTVYPGHFPEYGLCINSKLYGVYWDRNNLNAWLAEIVPGNYQSTATGLQCTFTVKPNCEVN